MELLFLYVADDKSVPSEGVNFGGRFLFQYHLGTRKLSITENPLFISDFFDEGVSGGVLNARISNITAVVGENGAGKTSLLNTIQQTLCRDYISGENTFITAVFENNGITVYYFDELLSDFPQVDDVVIHYESISVKKVQVSGGKPVEYGIEMPNLRTFETVDFIFFSNIFDQRQESESDGGRNISTNYLASVSETKKIRDRSVWVTPSRILDFKLEEIRRQVDLVNNFESDSLIPFTLPEKIRISVKGLSVRFSKISKRKGENESRESVAYKLLFNLYDLERKNLMDPVALLRHKFIGSAFFNFLSETEEEYASYTSIDGFMEHRLFDDLRFIDCVHYLLTNITLAILQVDRTNTSEQYELFKNLFKEKSGQLLLFIKMIQEFDFSEHNNIDEDGESFDLATTKEEISKFYQFYRIYSDSFFFTEFLDFQWRDISSGEKALFSIYSRFFALRNEKVVRLEHYLHQNIIVLLDEPDVFLHPSWQKQLVDNLKSFLSVVFHTDYDGNRRNIQIIFTTNNPLTITDLPHNNVLLLKRVDGQLITKDFSDSKRTFAANIFDLYTDAFFMDSGFTGAFAVRKINEVFKDLNDENALSEARQVEIKKIIQLIGEPLVKNKLIEMYHQKVLLNNDFENRLKRIEQKLFKDDRNKEK